MITISTIIQQKLSHICIRTRHPNVRRRYRCDLNTGTVNIAMRFFFGNSIAGKPFGNHVIVEYCGVGSSVGKNGAGKSTILKAIAGLEKPKSGSIVREMNSSFSLPTHS